MTPSPAPVPAASAAAPRSAAHCALFVEPVPPVRALHGHSPPSSPSPLSSPCPEPEQPEPAPPRAAPRAAPRGQPGHASSAASARVAPTVGAAPRPCFGAESESADEADAEPEHRAARTKASMGFGEGEGRGEGGLGLPGLRKAAFSTPALLPTQQPPHQPHHHHQRHRSEPDQPDQQDPDAALGARVGLGLDVAAMAKEADCVLQQQLRERERRIRQQDLADAEACGRACRVQVVQDKASRSAPQRGSSRSITVTASSRQGQQPLSQPRQASTGASTGASSRPQRWSLGGPGPAELLGALGAPRATWDAVLGAPVSPCASPSPSPTMSASPSSPARRNGALPGAAGALPTVSLVTQRRQQQQQQGHLRSGSNPERGKDFPATEHYIRFVYPERACPECPGCAPQGLDAGVQVSGPPPLQLRALPAHRYGCRRRSPAGAKGPAGRRRGAASVCLWLVQAVFCLAGLAVIILALALLGAAAFHATEGPHEDLQVEQLNRMQNDLVIRLATDLRVVVPDEAGWRAGIERSVERHEQMVLRAAAAGYGEGGAGEGGARIWTYPGGLLFAASLLTTLGFGAPVPRTTLGRLSAVALAVLGIPLNVVLALQLGRLLCTRLCRLLPMLAPAGPHTPGPGKRPLAAKRPGARSRPAAIPALPAPCSSCWPGGDCCQGGGGGGGGGGFRWAPLLLPIGSILVYYMVGMVLFGAVLALPFAEWLMFPLSLTAAGGVARVPGWVRVAYAAYLEGGVLLAAVAVALLQAPATTATTDLCMRLGILDLDDYYSA